MEATDELRQAADRLLMQPEPVAQEEPEVSDETEEAAPAPDEDRPDSDETEAIEATDDQDDEEADDADVTPRDRITVKVDGAEVEVSLDDLKRSYSGNAHIQKGMQEAAAAKKEAQAILEALQAEQQRFSAFAQQTQANGFLPMPKAPDPALAKTDPIGFIEAQAEFQSAMSAYQQQQAELQRYSAAQQAATRKQLEARHAQQLEALHKAIPALADPEKGKQLREDLRRTGQSYGFSEAELGGIDDARTVQVLHDAYQWRKLQSAKAAAKTAPPKNVKPAGKRVEPPQLARSRAIEKARQSGRLEDFAALLIQKPSS